MKNSLLLIVLVLIFSTGYSQNFHGGIVAGLNGGQIDGDTQRGFKKVGILAGMFVDYPISERLTVGAEIYYIGKGAVKKTELADGTVYEEFKTVLNYIEVPFLLRYKAFEKIWISAGIAPSYLINNKLYEGGVQRIDNYYPLRDYDIEPMIQADFRFFKKLGISLRYSFSVVTIRSDNENWYSKNLSLGLRYEIK